VPRDHQFDHLLTGPQRQRLLAAKNRHNAATMGLHLLVRFGYVLGLILIAFCPLTAWGWPGWVATLTSIVADLAFTLGYFVLVERAVTGFRPLRPRLCSIYQPDFWRHERFWKVPATAYLQIFNGTPFKALAWRLLGVRTGRRVFDDGAVIIERTLVSLGAEATLNAGVILQCHSMEDATFKSDRIDIGAAATVGTGAFVHYGVTVGEGAVIDTDSFLMKGEHVSPRAWWRGNPATEVLVRTPLADQYQSSAPGPEPVAIP
jgi:non-ribosomal peptide synthetase-like protein